MDGQIEKDVIREALELGTWLGREQAFSSVAAKASAADAHCLKEMRDGKQYLALGFNWEGFCKDYVGVSRQTADRIIHNLEEFGPQFFELTSLIRLPTDQYRQIAPAVTEKGLICDGETIAFSEENKPKLAAAIESLTPAPPAPKVDPAAALERARKSFRDSLQQYTIAWNHADGGAREELSAELKRNRAAMDLTAQRKEADDLRELYLIFK